MLEIIQLSVLTDNYIYIVHEPDLKQTAVIDPAVATPVLDALKNKGWSLDYIFNTHHHSDHVGANLELKEQTGCQIFASYSDRLRIPGIDKQLNHGDEVKLGNHIANVMAVPGHTLGHIVYHFPKDHVLFCGDTLFSMGCGRLFEGTAEQMWDSLQKIKKLPKQTKIYCAHEYTQSNGQFALTIDPDNQQLQQRMVKVDRLRAKSKATLPTTLDQELETNPFLREDDPAIKKNLGMTDKQACDVFRKIRELKDHF
jgi:hydroxyacylglutathione hydrolase